MIVEIENTTFDEAFQYKTLGDGAGNYSLSFNLIDTGYGGGSGDGDGSGYGVGYGSGWGCGSGNGNPEGFFYTLFNK